QKLAGPPPRWGPARQREVPLMMVRKVSVLFLGAILCVIVGGLADRAPAQGKDDDNKLFQGKWREWRSVQGPRTTADSGEGMVIDDDDIQYLWGGTNKGGKARFTVDPTKDPKHIEVVYTVGQERYHKRLGIYKLTGDRLEISVSAYESETRPTAFSGIKGA